MKKLLSTLAIAVCGYCVYAQTPTNTFPTTGNVGIGTVSPVSPLTIQASSSSPVLPLMTFKNSTGNTTLELRTPGDGTSLALGYNAGQHTTGIGNNFIGYDAGASNTTGNYNNFFGYTAGSSNTIGINNNFLGGSSGYYNTTGRSNNFIGFLAGLSNTNGSYNNFLGETSGHSNSTGAGNNFIGLSTGFANTTGNGNNFLGLYTGYKNTTGNDNNFIGFDAGYNNLTGINNNFIGYQAGYSNTASNNDFIGYTSGYFNTTGSKNTFMGDISGTLNTTGGNNSAFGYGANAGTTGSNNIAMGYNAGGVSGANLTTGSGNIVIGNQAGVADGTQSNQLSIGNLIYGTGLNGTGATVSSGKVGIGTPAPAANLEVRGTLLNGGQEANLDPAATASLSFLQNSGRMLIGWNRTASEGETDFIGNQGALGTNGGFAFYNYDNTGNLAELIRIKGNGYVGIGMANPDAKLSVNGNIHTQEVKVDMTGWNDYVFNKNYDLRPLTAVKAYIDENHHLPEIPSAAEVIKDGVKLGEMNKLLVKKVEELTLYLIEKDKQLNDQQVENNQQNVRIEALETALSKLTPTK